MIRPLILACAILALAACSPGGLVKGVAGAALGGGPNVAANVQAGRTNTQTVGTTRVVEQRLERVTTDSVEQSTGDTGVRTDRVETVVVRNAVPPWIWFLVIAGWVLPSPGEISRTIWGAFKRKGSPHANR